MTSVSLSSGENILLKSADSEVWIYATLNINGRAQDTTGKQGMKQSVDDFTALHKMSYLHARNLPNMHVSEQIVILLWLIILVIAVKLQLKMQCLRFYICWSNMKGEKYIIAPSNQLFWNEDAERGLLSWVSLEVKVLTASYIFTEQKTVCPNISKTPFTTSTGTLKCGTEVCTVIQVTCRSVCATAVRQCTSLKLWWLMERISAAFLRLQIRVTHRETRGPLFMRAVVDADTNQTLFYLPGITVTFGMELHSRCHLDASAGMWNRQAR